jgi:uncharacterized protein involved in exopolysaccharide biosynthesis
MSRIDEALRRITGTTAEPSSAFLKRFAAEEAPKPDEAKVSPYAPFPVEPMSAASHKVSARPGNAAVAPSQMTTPPDGGVPQLASTAEAAETPVGVETRVDEESLIDVRLYADYIGFAVGAVRRHKMLAIGTFCLAVATTAGAVVFLPRTYHVGVKLLAQRNEVIAALSNPGRAVPWDADAPTRAAAETVLRRENLIGLVKQTDLLNDWTRTRAPLLKLKDTLIALATQYVPDADEKLDQLVGLLGARMIVVAGPSGDGTVSIDIDWPNAQTAFNLVEAAQQAFLDARQRAETAAITESITILERYSATLHESINRTLEELQHTQSKRPSPGGTPRVATARRSTEQVASAALVTSMLPPVPAALLGEPALGGNLDDPEIPRLKATLTAKRLEITALEEQRQRQLTELQVRLSQLTTIYTPSHPAVQSTQQNIAALSRDTPQLMNLKAELKSLDTEYQTRVAALAELEQEEQLKAEFARRTAPTTQAEPVAREPERRPVLAAAEPTNAASPTGPAGPNSKDGTDFAAVRLRLQLNQLESVLERTDGARIEMAVSQAAFKYRYTVIQPAQVPRRPSRPNLTLVAFAGFIASLVLALAAAVGKDLIGDRIIERWQIERQLGLPVLGTLGRV